MDGVIFGDNQFFGINHMSEAKAQSQLERFSDSRAIIEVLDAACEAGLRGFMFSTHARVRELCDHFRSQRSSYKGVRFYPVIPYAHKYAAAVAERGVAGLAADVMNSPRQLMSAVRHGGKGLIWQDPFEIMKALVDVEMLMFRDLDLGVVFLQNIVADLVLGLGLGAAFVQLSEYVKSRYGAEVGVMTMNLPAMMACLKKQGVERPIVCAAINKIGYLMNPDRNSYERTIAAGGFRPVAMSILASGAIEPRAAFEYVCQQPNIEALVFGASSKSNISASLALIREFGCRRATEVI